MARPDIIRRALALATALQFAEEFVALMRFCRFTRLPIDEAGAKETAKALFVDVLIHRLDEGPIMRLTLKDAGLGLVAGNVIAVSPDSGV